jgi:hypothetical protein
VPLHGDDHPLFDNERQATILKRKVPLQDDSLHACAKRISSYYDAPRFTPADELPGGVVDV